MTFEFDYSMDSEFSRLLARDTDVDLAVLSLEFARDVYPNLSFAPTLDWIDARAAELRPLIAQSVSEWDVLEIVAATISDRHGIAGSTVAYEEADGSFVHRVIEKRRGIPISLAALYCSICRRVDVRLEPVAAPMHVLTRVDSLEGPLFLDGFAGQRILNHEQAIHWLSSISGVDERQLEFTLEPADGRTIATRMLTNLKILYARQDNWHAAWPVQNRLVALNPSLYPERRDLALIAVKADRPAAAVRLLKSLLSVCPDEDRKVLQSELEAAEKQIHRWN